ncbi:MAG: hypothetical protein ACLUNS_01965 [Alistipes shahii]
MWCSVVAALLNVVLDWLFIFPLGWGVMGAAFATAISVSVGGVIVVVYLSFSHARLRFCPLKRSRKSLRSSLRNVGYQCRRIGSSALLGEATLAMLMFVGNLDISCTYPGDDGVGAFGIACYYIPFVFMVGNAIAQSAQPISYNLGAGVRERGDRGLRTIAGDGRGLRRGRHGGLHRQPAPARRALPRSGDAPLHASPSRGCHGSPWASFVLSSI